MSAAFDTLRIARDLEAAGIERRHAEAHAQALRIVADSASADSATKADLDAAIAGLETRFVNALAANKADIDTAIAGLETRLMSALAAKADKSELAGIRAELATIRWAIGLLAAFMLAIGLRVFGIF